MESKVLEQLLEVNSDINRLLDLIKTKQNEILTNLTFKKIDYGYLGDFKQTRSDLEDVYSRLSEYNS